MKSTIEKPKLMNKRKIENNNNILQMKQARQQHLDVKSFQEHS